MCKHELQNNHPHNCVQLIFLFTNISILAIKLVAPILVKAIVEDR